MAAKEKPCHDSTWRSRASGKVLLPVPEASALRFKTPKDGVVIEYKRAGRIEFPEQRASTNLRHRPPLTARPPTTSVCDDMDTKWSLHVDPRRRDHVNNTPRQIHIFEALGSVWCPSSPTCPRSRTSRAEKMSKRNLLVLRSTAALRPLAHFVILITLRAYWRRP